MGTEFDYFGQIQKFKILQTIKAQSEKKHKLGEPLFWLTLYISIDRQRIITGQDHMVFYIDLKFCQGLYTCISSEHRIISRQVED